MVLVVVRAPISSNPVRSIPVKPTNRELRGEHGMARRAGADKKGRIHDFDYNFFAGACIPCHSFMDVLMHEAK
jgi:hypothetical protein